MIYINGLASISPQPNLNQKEFLSQIRQYKSNMLQCIEPDYAKFFHPNSLRRMGRVLKLGWAGAKSCLDDAGIEKPESICIGTGKGCYKNTHLFLLSVDENQEKFVPPSPFIQSAHGSIAAQIAIQTGCRNYNMTYAHRTFSFESALQDAIMLLKEGKHKNVLLGGVDEIEEIQFKTFDRIGHYKQAEVHNLDLFETNSRGTIAGEGSNFFLLENHANHKTYASVQAVSTFSNPDDISEIKSRIIAFLNHENLSIDDLDLILLGFNGDLEFDNVYYQMMNGLFLNKSVARFKHLVGEFHTSSAFAMLLASKIIQEQHIPKIISGDKKPRASINNVLIYNQYRNVNHSLMLISR